MTKKGKKPKPEPVDDDDWPYDGIPGMEG